MFTNTHLERYADVLLWGLQTARSGKLKHGEIFLVRYNIPAVELAEILQARLLEMGMHPVLRSDATPIMERHFFDLANPQQLVFQPPGDKAWPDYIRPPASRQSRSAAKFGPAPVRR